jgi:hypothetical protein
VPAHHELELLSREWMEGMGDFDPLWRSLPTMRNRRVSPRVAWKVRWGDSAAATSSRCPRCPPSTS